MLRSVFARIVFCLALLAQAAAPAIMSAHAATVGQGEHCQRLDDASAAQSDDAASAVAAVSSAPLGADDGTQPAPARANHCRDHECCVAARSEIPGAALIVFVVTLLPPPPEATPAPFPQGVAFLKPPQIVRRAFARAPPFLIA